MRPVNRLVSGLLNLTSRVAPPLAGRAAFALFRLPVVRARLSPRERAVIELAHRGSMTVHDKTVVTYRWGSGERPVLLVHGWRSRAARFAEFVPSLLERGYSPIAFDAPGHGESGGTATTILEYREIISGLGSEYGVFEAVVGHSFGVLASFVALREGAGVRARRVVAISGVSEFAYLVDEFCRLLRFRPWLDTDLRARIERDLLPGEPDIWVRLSATYRPESVRIPILVVHDEDDDMARIDQAERVIAAYGSQVRAVITRDLGHRTLRDPSVVAAVGEFVAAVGEFVAADERFTHS